MKHTQVKTLFGFFVIVAIAVTTHAAEKTKPISAKSKAVRDKIDLHSPTGGSHIYGFNYQPSWGDTGLTVWGEKFDPARYREELTIGKKHFPKMNAVRIWLSWRAYQENPERMIRNFQQAMDICGDLDLLVIPAIFNRWTGNPLWDHVERKELLSDFQTTFAPFIRDLVTPMKGDQRILAWDLCNEPFAGIRRDKPQISPDVKIRWLGKIYDVVKACDPDALTCIGTIPNTEIIIRTSHLQDILTPHLYYPVYSKGYKTHPPKLKEASSPITRIPEAAEVAKRHRKPIISTECCWGSDFDEDRVFIIRTNLEMLKKYKMGFFPHALWTSGVADLHKHGKGHYMPFILEDGSVRPGHEVYNEFTK